MQRPIRYFCAVPFIFLTCAAKAACVLPIPDTGAPNASDRNLAGYLLSYNHGKTLIQEYKTKKQIYVDVSSVDAPYSAFGGDGTFSELKPGIAVRVWFKRCVKPRKGIPVAAYFELFSNDPLDQPDNSYSYFTRKGQ